MTSSSTPNNVQTLLATLRDAPVDIASDAVLGTLLEYLMGVAPSPPNNTFHWYCRHALPITVDAATFLIRLFAYQSENVNPWKSRMQSCLSSCAECVQGLERVKVTSKDT
jgi:senataxin